MNNRYLSGVHGFRCLAVDIAAKTILNKSDFLLKSRKLCKILNKRVLLRTYGLHCEFAKSRAQ
jgi:hypothetical protein